MKIRQDRSSTIWLYVRNSAIQTVDWRVHWILWLFMLIAMFSSATVWAKAELMGVRIGEHPDKTRVVFEVRKNLGFHVTRLESPPRLVVDFVKAQDHLSFKKKALKTSKIKQVRVNRLHMKTQVVLDLKRAFTYRYFTLGKNKRGNERLVIDIQPNTVLASQKAPTHKKQPHQVKVQPKKAQPKLVQSVEVAKKASQSASIVQTVKPSVVMAKKVVKKAIKQQVAVVAKLPKAHKKVQHQHVSHSTSKPKHLASRHPAYTENVFNGDALALLKKMSKAPLDSKKQVVVAIDAGHGGKDTGAIGAKGIYEKNVTLALAKQLKRFIDAQPGMKAVLTRTGDYFIPLHDRVKIAHQKHADIFISVHADSYPSKKVSGGSIYVLSTSGASSVMAKLLARSENASLKDLKLSETGDADVAFALSDMAREANIRASRQLAKRVLFEMQKSVKVHKHTVQSADFAVLKSIDMPSMLIETAFISNPHEEKNLASKRFQIKMAKAIVRGVKQFVASRAVKPSWGEPIYVHYRVQRGDTLSEIAANYKISVKRLKQLNHIHNANQLYVGKKLKIPLNMKMVAGL